MDLALMNKIAKSEGVQLSEVFMAVAVKRIAWDNCAGRIVTMANTNEVVYVTKAEDQYIAHFEHGDEIISDIVEKDEIRLVT